MNFSSGTVAVAAGADARDVNIVFTPGHLRYSVLEEAFGQKTTPNRDKIQAILL